MKVEDYGLDPLAGFKHLQWLDIGSNSGNGSRGMRAPRSLKYLSIMENWEFGQRGQLMEHCPDELLGFATGENGLKGLGELLLKKNFERLEMLKIQYDYIEKTEIEHIVNAIKKLRSLKYLALDDRFVNDEVNTLVAFIISPFKLISTLCVSCPNLQTLDITYEDDRVNKNQFVTSLALHKLGKLTKLKRLNLEGLPVDDEVIARITPSLKELKYLSITSRISYTEGLWTLIRNCPKLVGLSLGSSTQGVNPYDIRIDSIQRFYPVAVKDVNRAIDDYLELCEREQWRKRREALVIHKHGDLGFGANIDQLERCGFCLYYELK